MSSNQFVEAGDLLFQVDRDRYELAVETAEANLQSARQATGASTANIDAAQAQVASAKANLLRAEQDVVRLRRIKQEDPGAISDRRVEMAEASYTAAKAAVSAAEANLERARQDLGETGEANYRILQAQAGLDQARLDLQRTSVVAPDDGVVTDVRVDRGNFAQAGAPLMTFLASHDIWVQADFTENNLGNIKPGDEVEIVFDALPGTVVKGTIRTTGFGVNVESAPLGSLPTISNDRQWLRDSQRFSVLVDPRLEAWPGAQERLVRDLDDARAFVVLVPYQEAAPGQRLELPLRSSRPAWLTRLAPRQHPGQGQRLEPSDVRPLWGRDRQWHGATRRMHRALPRRAGARHRHLSPSAYRRRWP